jgi:hypothetical protein
MKIRWIPEFDYTRAKEKVAPSEKEKTMQRMRIRMRALVQSQAAVLSYVDMYWLLAMASVIMFVASFLLKRNEPGRGEKVSVH